MTPSIPGSALTAQKKSFQGLMQQFTSGKRLVSSNHQEYIEGPSGLALNKVWRWKVKTAKIMRRGMGCREMKVRWDEVQPPFSFQREAGKVILIWTLLRLTTTMGCGNSQPGTLTPCQHAPVLQRSPSPVLKRRKQRSTDVHTYFSSNPL